MRYFLLLLLFILALPSLAAEPTSSCTDPDMNQQWEKAQSQYPNDPLVLKLSSLRGALCSMIASKQIDVETARFIWEHALINALLGRAREEQERRGLLRLFGTF